MSHKSVKYFTRKGHKERDGLLSETLPKVHYPRTRNELGKEHEGRLLHSQHKTPVGVRRSFRHILLRDLK